MEDLKEYIEKLKEQFVQMTDTNYCNLTTGEVFTLAEVNKYMSRKIEEFNLMRNADIIRTARENGIEVEQRLINKRSKKKKSEKCKYDTDRLGKIDKGFIFKYIED